MLRSESFASGMKRVALALTLCVVVGTPRAEASGSAHCPSEPKDVVAALGQFLADAGAYEDGGAIPSAELATARSALQSNLSKREADLDQLYCLSPKTKGPDAWMAKDGSGCSNAAVTIWPDGRMTYQKKAEAGAGSWCLDPSWSPDARALVYPRAGGPLSGASRCGKVVPGTVYKPPETDQRDPVAEIHLWGRRPADLEAAETAGVIKQSKNAYKRFVEAAYLRGMAEKLSYPDAGAGDALVNDVATLSQATLDRIIDPSPSSPYCKELPKLCEDAYKDARAAALGSLASWEQDRLAAQQPTPPTLAQPLRANFRSTTPIDGLKPRPLELLADDVDPSSDELWISFTALAWPPDAHLLEPLVVAQFPATSTGVGLYVQRSGDGMAQKDVAPDDGASLFFAYDLAKSNPIVAGNGPPAASDGGAPDAGTGDQPFVINNGAITQAPSDLAVLASNAIADFQVAMNFSKGTPVMAGVNSLKSKYSDFNLKLSSTCTLPEKVTASWIRAQIWSPPSGIFTSKVIVQKPLAADTEYAFLICRAGEDCGAGDKVPKEELLTADMRVRATSHPFVSIGVEEAVNINVEPRQNGYPLNGYQFQKVTGSGPNDYYILDGDNSAPSYFSTSTLVLAYPAAHVDCKYVRGIALGIGPTIFEGGKATFLRQWNFRGGYEPWFARGLVLTAGVSWRWVDAPVNLSEGTVVSVASGANAPVFETTSKVIPMFSVGLTLDLGVVGTAIQDATSKLQPSSSSSGSSSGASSSSSGSGSGSSSSSTSASGKGGS